MAFAAVERAHGTIRVRSEPGHGTTFRIHLPLADADGAIVADDPSRLTAGRAGSESILLLEDDPLVRELLVTILRAGGYAVSVAALPSEALALADGRRFDLLVSDVVMPEMTGNIVAARLRLMQPDLRVILMSGYTAKARRRRPRSTRLVRAQATHAERGRGAGARGARPGCPGMTDQTILRAPPVLVVDDDVAVRGLIVFALREAGLEVLEVDSAEEALETIEGAQS